MGGLLSPFVDEARIFNSVRAVCLLCPAARFLLITQATDSSRYEVSHVLLLRVAAMFQMPTKQAASTRVSVLWALLMGSLSLLLRAWAMDLLASAKCKVGGWCFPTNPP